MNIRHTYILELYCIFSTQPLNISSLEMFYALCNANIISNPSPSSVLDPVVCLRHNLILRQIGCPLMLVLHMPRLRFPRGMLLTDGHVSVNKAGCWWNKFLRPGV